MLASVMYLTGVQLIQKTFRTRRLSPPDSSSVRRSERNRQHRQQLVPSRHRGHPGPLTGHIRGPRCQVCIVKRRGEKIAVQGGCLRRGGLLERVKEGIDSLCVDACQRAARWYENSNKPSGRAITECERTERIKHTRETGHSRLSQPWRLRGDTGPW